jgi:NAD(P)-dependent dehydrogenase (short-subunit alcohol dehydrogenase family)
MMRTSDANKPLAGKIAVVAGATRGAGRGIATMLGAAGATVICTGRSTRGNPATPGRPETIEETAELVTAAGGTGVALRVDHTIADEVRALFERVEHDFQRLDILVNDIWGGDELTEWGKPFWKLDPAKGLKMQELAVQTHILTARFGAPMMVRQKSGLIVEITDGLHLDYRGNLFYYLAKISAIRLAYAMAAELRRHKVVALALTPGFLRSEAMLDGFGVSEANWRDAIAQNADFAESETPAYVGRAVAALAADPNVASRRAKCVQAGRSRASTASTIRTAVNRTGARISHAWWLTFSIVAARTTYTKSCGSGAATSRLATTRTVPTKPHALPLRSPARAYRFSRDCR